MLYLLVTIVLPLPADLRVTAAKPLWLLSLLTVATLGLKPTLPSGRITEIGIKFKSATSTTSSVADIYSIVLCSTIEEAKAYTGVQDKSDINAISATLLGANISDVDYSKADTEMKALKQAKIQRFML